MKFNLFILLIFLTSCLNQKSTFICGDHKCINKNEAKQYFEENLTIEVSIRSNDKETRYDLVSLNLDDKKKQIQVFKNNNKKIIKELSKEEIKKKKKDLKKKQNIKIAKAKKNKEKKLSVKNNNKMIINNKSLDNLSDICLKVEKCDIDSISTYLIKKSYEKDFPNISLKE